MVERIFTISTIINCATSTFHRRLFLNCFHRLDIVYCRVIDEFCADVSRSPTKLIRTEWKFYWLEIKIKKNGEESETRTNLPTISAVIRIGNENLETSRKCFPYFYIFQDSSYFLQEGDAS